MITCDPNELVAPIHPKAMITILRPDDVETWLHGSYDEVVALQRPYNAAAMTVRGPVFSDAREPSMSLVGPHSCFALTPKMVHGPIAECRTECI